MAEELHIASLVVHAQPEEADAVTRAIQAMAGAEVPHRQGGKLVVTLETADEGQIVDTLTRLQLLHGVLAATLVYHHAEPLHDDPHKAEPITDSQGVSTP